MSTYHGGGHAHIKVSTMMGLFYENVGMFETLPLFGEEAYHVNTNITQACQRVLQIELMMSDHNDR